jgi:GAF domain-containing protein
LQSDKLSAQAFLSTSPALLICCRYLQAWRNTYRPSAAFDISPFQVDASDPRVVQKVCPDSALLAFAQLATWRLNARRAFVTLVDADREYVLAEASKSMAFQHDRVKDMNDAASIGTCSFPRSDALTDRVLITWQAARHIREPSTKDDHYYTEGVSPHWQVLRDLRHDSECQDVPFVQHARWGRFYCAVPLRSAQGSVIGSVFIMDDRPRYGISEEQLTFLEVFDGSYICV